jgi:nucleotide-binding universal stress UspA family protein
MLKHIVVGCDGTAAGRDAVALATQLSRTTRAGLTLVGVCPPSVFPVVQRGDRQALRRQAEARLRQERDLLAPDARVEAVTDTSVARALRQYAIVRDADMVVIGSDRAAAAGHVMISRRGRQLLDESPFAVALAPSGLHERRPRLEAIGIGYDATPESKLALRLAAQLARRADASLQVRRVVENQIPALNMEEWIASADLSPMWEGVRQAALDDAMAAVHTLAVPAEVYATVGDPGFELRTASRGVELFVLGSRGWGPTWRLTTGGVGETLLSDAYCSVIMVPRGGGVPGEASFAPNLLATRSRAVHSAAWR